MVNAAYITVRCPLCSSISNLRAAGIRSDVFFCPVCLDGEIELQERSQGGRPGTHDLINRERFGLRLSSLGAFTVN